MDEMGKAQLVVGQPRIGWLIDGDDSTPLIGVALEDTGTAIQLRVPWSREANTDHVLRWFSKGIQFGDDPDRVKHQYRPPHHLWFRDPAGIVALVGTRAGSSRNVITHGLGEGRVTVDYAVLGAGFADYSVLNGLRSEFEGLTDWVGIRCLQEESEQDAEHRLAELRLTLRAPDAVKISRALNLRLQPHFSTERTVDRDLAIHETIVVESSARKGRRWVDHLTAHNAVRDLVAIAWWHLGAYRGQWVTRSTDPLRAIDGTSYGEQWLELRTHKHVRGDPTHPQGWPLFSFTDVGANGLRRWQRLRAAHARGINPLLATLNPRNSGLEANLTVSCIGLDGIGFQLALDAGVGKSKANMSLTATACGESPTRSPTTTRSTSRNGRSEQLTRITGSSTQTATCPTS